MKGAKNIDFREKGVILNNASNFQLRHLLTDPRNWFEIIVHIRLHLCFRMHGTKKKKNKMLLFITTHLADTLFDHLNKQHKMGSKEVT